MPIVKVVFYSESDREEGVKKIEITGQNLGFIIKGELGWGDFYRYIMSVGEITELDEVPE